MLTIQKKTDCSGCGGCRQVCPQQCISYEPDSEGFLYPRIDTSRCIGCGRCDRVCPMTQSVRRDPENERVYACINPQEPVRLQSSSGGIFPLLAAETIAEGGSVFGAVFEKGRVVHHRADTVEEAAAFQGSKYVQSDMKNCFVEAKERLQSGKRVLFSGTPCQIYGLSCYLSREYENLLTTDCVCMGVPSPEVWRKYREYREQEAGGTACGVSFRDKSTGWKDYSLSMKFANGGDYRNRHNDDLYLKGFGHCLFLRPACHECRFKDLRSRADLTLGDYWGVGSKFPGLDDDRGVSMVLVNTPKGREAFARIKDRITCMPSDWKHAVSTHPSMVKSVAPDPRRSAFFAELQALPVETLLQKYTRPTGMERVKKTVKRLLGRK